MRTWQLIGTLWGLCVVSVVSGAAAEDASPIRPLALAGQRQQIIDQALIDLSRGNTTALEELPIAAFLEPIARPDNKYPGLSFRWTMALPSALARLDEPTRARTLARLDTRYQTLLTPDLSNHERARLAVSFLPAPTALMNVQHAANVAFDHGRLADYLGITHLLPPAPLSEQRQAIALQLSGLGPEVDTSLQLVKPGPALATTTSLTVTPQHLAVRWHTMPGWVLALDPFEQIIWQYRVDRNATVITGPGAVLVRDSQGLRALNEAGDIQLLTPLPLGAQILEIAGGAAWFATGKIGWRLALADGQVSSLALEEFPCGPPLVRGHHSLWLTDRSFILFENNREIHRYRHQLPVGMDWQLIAKDLQPYVQSPDGRQWQVAAFAEQLSQGTVLQRAQLLISANRFQEALNLLAESSDAASQSLALRARIGLTLQQQTPLPPLDSDREMAATDRALLLSAYFADADNGRSHVSGQAPLAAQSLYKAMDELAGTYPDVEFSAAKETLIDRPERWDHRFSTTAWKMWRETSAFYPAQINPLTPILPPTNAPASDTNNAIRDEDGALRWQQHRYQLARTPDVITVQCRNNNNEFLWQQRWRPYAFASAPSQHLDVRNGYVYIQEGDARLVVLDALLGILVGEFPLIDPSSTVYYLSPNHLACLGPLGVNTMLTIYSAQGREQPIPLPTAARWACIIGDQLVLCLGDRVIAYPSGQTLMWPKDVIQLKTAPTVTQQGLQAGSQLWPWGK